MAEQSCGGTLVAMHEPNRMTSWKQRKSQFRRMATIDVQVPNPNRDNNPNCNPRPIPNPNPNPNPNQ